MRACFLLERGSPPRLNPIIAGVFDILSSRGVGVSVLYAEEELVRLDTLSASADLYLLKSDSELSLSLATALEAMGAKVVNPVSACIRSKDKVLAAATLAKAGIQAPRSFASSDPAHLASELSRGPLILKPHRGYHGAGITVVGGTEELPDAKAYPEVVFAQRYLSRARKDLKVFGIGEEVFGVRKAFSEDSFLKAGEPCVLPRDVEDTARRCAQAFGLELYGLDMAEDDEGVWVIDVNYFPGYRGVPDASRRLAMYILEQIWEHRTV